MVSYDRRPAEAVFERSERSVGSCKRNDYGQKTFSQQMPSFASMTPAASFNPYAYPSSGKRVDISDERVGVIIGKGGETIKYLQQQSGGCKIQVTRDADADPYSQTRTVELTGASEQISKTEKLINDLLAEAEAGVSGFVAARKFVSPQVGGEQFSMQVPNNKVGLIIGKGGRQLRTCKLAQELINGITLRMLVGVIVLHFARSEIFVMYLARSWSFLGSCMDFGLNMGNRGLLAGVSSWITFQFILYRHQKHMLQHEKL